MWFIIMCNTRSGQRSSLPVEDLSSMAEVESSEKLEHKESDIVGVERAWPLLHVMTEVSILQVQLKSPN